MAIVVQEGKGFIYVKLDGSNSFDYSTATFTTGTNAGEKVSTVFPQGLSLSAIKYAAPSAGAVLVVRTESATGPIISQLSSIDGGALKDYFINDIFYKPYLTHADQTTDTNAQVWFEFRNEPT
jgi:hypothetical protein